MKAINQIIVWTNWKQKTILRKFEISRSQVNRWRQEKTKKPCLLNPFKILNEEIEKVFEYRTSNEDKRLLGYRKFTWKMVDENIAYLSESAVVTVGAKNAAVDVVYATKELLESKKQLEKAKDDYDKYKANLSKAKDDLRKGLIDSEDYEALESQEKYYKINLGIMTANVATKIAGLVTATINAAGSAKTYGFSGDMQLDIDAKITKTRSDETKQLGSNILTGGNLSIKSGKTAKIQGSNAEAKGDMLIDAQNVEILAAQNTTVSNTDSKYAKVSINVSTSGGVGVNMSAGLSGSTTESTTNVNSHLLANNITIKSKNDTTVRGGVVKATDALTLNVGRDLIVESVQDTTKSGSFSIGINAGVSNSGKSGSAGGNFSVSNSSSKWVNEQTSLTGGKVNIYVENKTTLTGAVINSTTGDLKIDTGSFEYKNLKDKNVSFSNGASVSVGGLGTDKKNFSVGVNYGYSDKRQTNFATVGEGTIIVRDGKTDISKLNRDVTRAQYTTVDVGLSGGIKVDSATVNMLTSPIQTAENLKNALVQGFNDGRATTEGLIERTSNLVNDYGFKTNQEVRKERMYNAVIALVVSEFTPSKTVKNGVFINEVKGEILSIIDYSPDGTQKNTYQYGKLENIIGYKQENYIVADGQQIKSHELIYSDDSKIANTYDSSGNNINRSVMYQYNDGSYDLKSVDEWKVDSKSGMLLPSQIQPNDWTCVAATYGNMLDLSVNKVLELAKEAKAIDGNNNMKIYKFANQIDKDLINDKILPADQIRSILDNNLNTDTRTELRFSAGHSTMLSGARYDSSGNITNYWMNDPGRVDPARDSRSKTVIIDRNTLYDPKWGNVQKARYLEDQKK